MCVLWVEYFVMVRANKNDIEASREARDESGENVASVIIAKKLAKCRDRSSSEPALASSSWMDCVGSCDTSKVHPYYLTYSFVHRPTLTLRTTNCHATWDMPVVRLAARVGRYVM